METSPSMVGAFLKDALEESVNTLGGSNPFSEACLTAMDYGRRTIINDDWKKVFRDDELDAIIAKMLRIPAVSPTDR